MPTYVVIEVEGTGRDKEGSEQLAADMIKKYAMSGGVRANIQVCAILQEETPRPFERLLRVSKGSA